MPQLVWLYLTARLYFRASASSVALAEALQIVSHDRLMRLPQPDWSGQILIESACRTLFLSERGDLIHDDTVIPKPFATAMEGLAWVSSSQERKPVYAFSETNIRLNPYRLATTPKLRAIRARPNVLCSFGEQPSHGSTHRLYTDCSHSPWMDRCC
jgi:hypothetical protein